MSESQKEFEARKEAAKIATDIITNAIQKAILKAKILSGVWQLPTIKFDRKPIVNPWCLN